jgi:ParB-like chromosome segregation protein Spo0J
MPAPLIMAKDPVALAKRIVAEELSVRETEALAKAEHKSAGTAKKKTAARQIRRNHLAGARAGAAAAA